MMHLENLSYWNVSRDGVFMLVQSNCSTNHMYCSAQLKTITEQVETLNYGKAEKWQSTKHKLNVNRVRVFIIHG